MSTLSRHLLPIILLLNAAVAVAQPRLIWQQQGAVIRGLTQDNVGGLFAARNGLLSVDPMTGVATSASVGMYDPGQSIDLVYISADPYSERFAVKIGSTLEVYGGRERDTLLMRINEDRGPGNVSMLQEPLEVLQFTPASTDVVVLSYVSFNSGINALVHQCSPTSTSTPDVELLAINTVDVGSSLRGVCNTEATSFALYDRDHVMPVRIIGDTDLVIQSATSVLYHPLYRAYIMDLPQGLQVLSDRAFTIEPPIDLGQPCTPLAIWPDSSRILGWLHTSQTLAVVDLVNGAVLWQSEQRTRPLHTIMDASGMWFVASYADGLFEGYATDRSTSVTEGNDDDAVKLYPNPAHDHITIHTSMPIISWTVHDMIGALIATGSGTLITTNTFASGTYSLTIVGSHTSATKRIVVR